MTDPWPVLQGPRRFVAGIREALAAGRTTIVAVPKRLTEVVPRLIWSDIGESLQAERLFAEKSIGPLEQLALHCGMTGSAHSIEDLVQAPEFRDRIILIEMFDPDTWGEWTQWFGDYAPLAHRQSSFDRTSFCAVTSASDGVFPTNDAWLNTVYFDDVVDRVDATLAAALLMAHNVSQPVERALRLDIVANLALWDIGFASGLAELNISGLLEPWEFLADWASRQGWGRLTEPNGQFLWDIGARAHFEGSSTLHSAWLEIIGDRRAVAQRVWRAQVMSLFPRLEERRAHLVNKHRRTLRRALPLSTVFGAIEKADDLELGHIRWVLCRRGAVSAAVRDELRTLCALRNDLTHFDPAARDLVLDTLKYLA